MKEFFLNFLAQKTCFRAKNGEKWQSQKNFGRNFFWSESIQNVLKRMFKRKSRNRKFFPLQYFLLDLVIFGQNSEKMAKSKNFG